MNTLENIVATLRQTLVDDTISRSELQAVRELLREANLDTRELALLRSEIFDLAREQSNQQNASSLLDWVEDASKIILEISRKPPQRIHSDAYFSPGDDCLNAIIGCIRSARRTLDICVFTITDDRIVEAIQAAWQRRVAIRIIADNDKARDGGSDIGHLDRMGIPVKVDLTPNHMHHKFALIDGERVLTGSYNWTLSAAMSNQENLLVTDEAKLLTAYQAEFDRLWRTMAPY